MLLTQFQDKKIWIFVLIMLFFSLTSCNILTHQMTVDSNSTYRSQIQAAEEVVPIGDSSLLSYADLLITEEFGDPRVVEIYKDEILNNGERKFLEMLSYYRNGELLAAKILFDNLLETLEYLYGDKKVSDRIMLQNFWEEFSNQGVKSSVDLFTIYNSLFSDENLFQEPLSSRELVIEQGSSAPIEVRQNNEPYIYIENRLNEILSRYGKKAADDFIKTVYENYTGHLNDRIGVREMYIRSQRYSNFINSKLRENDLPELYRFVPAVMTSFYEGPRNGSIWRLENIREYRSIRNDTGASTAEVISRIKSLRSGRNDLEVISSIFNHGKYAISPSEIVNDIFTDDMANFFAIAVILDNPDYHDLISAAGISEGEEKGYFSSYEKYLKDPKQFAVSTPSTRRPQQTTRQSAGRGTSFIRINYRVKRGDNLQKIADLFGVTVAQLRQWNPRDTSGRHIHPGMTLYIRGDNFEYYTARSGDSIGRIAQRSRMSVTEFKEINGLTSDNIFAGRRYIVKKR